MATTTAESTALQDEIVELEEKLKKARTRLQSLHVTLPNGERRPVAVQSISRQPSKRRDSHTSP